MSEQTPPGHGENVPPTPGIAHRCPTCRSLVQNVRPGVAPEGSRTPLLAYCGSCERTVRLP